MSSPGRDDQDDLLRRAAEGEEEARMTLIGQYRERLLRAIAVHLDSRVRRRVDPSDVLQEATIDAVKRFDDYFRNPPLAGCPVSVEFGGEIGRVLRGCAESR